MGKTTIEELIVELGGDITGLDKAFKKAEKKLAKAERNLSKAGTSLTKNVTAPIVGISAGLIKVGDDFDKAFAKIRIGTGKTGKELDSLNKSFENVFEKVPDGAETVAGALTSLNTLTGSTGDTLELLTQSVLDVSRILGEDAATNASAFGQVLTQWSIPAKDGIGLMDDLFQITQDYDISLSKLTTSLNTYGSVMQNAGFSVEETAVLMGKMNAAGLSWSRISPGLNKAFRDMAKEGVNMREGFENAVYRIKEAKDETVALTIATEIFGAEGAQRLTTGIRKNIISLDDLTKSLKNNKGLVKKTTKETRTLSDEFGIMKNETLKAVKPLAKDLLRAFKDLIPEFKKIIGHAKNGVTWFRGLSPETKKLAGQIALAAVAAGPLVLVLGKIIGVVGTTVTTVKALTSILLKTGPWGIAIGAAVLAVGFIVDKMGGWDEAIKKTKNFVNGLMTTVTTAWDSVKTSTKLMYEDVKLYLQDKFGGIVDTVKKLIDTVDKAFFGLYDAVVGNSYIPDMVDEIGEQMGPKLKSKMVDRTKKNIDMTEILYEDMADSIDDVNYQINNSWKEISEGFGGAIGDMIIDGENFLDSMKAVFKDMVKSYISSIVTMEARKFALDGGSASIGGSVASIGIAAAGNYLLGKINAAKQKRIENSKDIIDLFKKISDVKERARDLQSNKYKILGNDEFRTQESITEFNLNFVKLQAEFSSLTKALKEAPKDLSLKYSEEYLKALNDASIISNTVFSDGLITDKTLYNSGANDFETRNYIRESFDVILEAVKSGYKQYLVGNISKSELKTDFSPLRESLLTYFSEYWLQKNNIPQFANGGIVTAPTLGLVGESGSEAIIPLSKLPEMTGGGSQTIIVNLDSRVIAKTTVKHMPSILRLQGVSI